MQIRTPYSAAKRDQRSTSNSPDNAKQPPLNEFPTKDQNIPNEAVVSVTQVVPSDETVPPQPHPIPSDPSSQQSPPSQTNSQPSAQSEPTMSDLMSLIMNSNKS